MREATGPEVVELRGGEADDPALARAVRALEDGGLVAFPTDTVYGLGAAASMPDAVDRLYKVKGRDRAKPVARLVPDTAAAERVAGEWPPLARELARAYWPGALTVVVGGTGFRVPDHPFARALAARARGGLLATSANRSGGADPRTAADVVAALGRDVDLVLDGGETSGTPSTVVRVEGTAVEMLREGAVSAADLAALARQDEGKQG